MYVGRASVPASLNLVFFLASVSVTICILKSLSQFRATRKFEASTLLWLLLFNKALLGISQPLYIGARRTAHGPSLSIF
jgi:hypothetical protein